MPITYEVHKNGHVIHAIAKKPLTPKEFVDFEIAHAIDNRITAPVFELLEISMDALKNITKKDMMEVIRRRGEIERRPTPHQCAIVLGSCDEHSWELAKFYEGMVMLHSPEVVIVFSTADIAKKWIGFEEPQQT